MTADLEVVGLSPGPVARLQASLPATTGPWLAAAGAACTCIAVNIADPNAAGNYPTCPFLAITGLQCPGCGTLRTVRALTHGDVLLAASLNALTLLLLPVLAWGWFGWLQARRGRREVPSLPSWAGVAIAVAVPAFWVARNVPVEPLSWLAP